jgi:Domain of unknown function (DUF4124)
MHRRFFLAVLLTLAAAPAAAAGTYKWVDDKGVVNYSNAPPPAIAAKAQLVAERISVAAPDPSLGAAVAAMNARAAQRARYEEADWQMRQRYLLASRASYPPANPYGSSYYPLVYTPGFVIGPARRSFSIRR